MLRRVLIRLVVLAFCGCFGSAGTLAAMPVAPASPGAARAAQDVVILSSSAYPYGDYVCVVGEVRNDTAGNVRSVRVTATYHDGSGGVLGTASAYTKHSILVPGRKSPFLILYEPPAGYAGYDLAVTYSATDLTPAPQLLLRSVRQIPDEPGWLTLIGEVENPAASNVEYVEVFLTLYDAGGKVLNLGSAYLWIEVLTPGQRAPFRIYVSAGPVAFASYGVSTEADPTIYDPLNLRSLNVTNRIHQGELRFTGEVENLEQADAEFVQAVVTLYDAAGDIVNCEYAFTDPDTIPPGERASFDIVVPDNYQGWVTYSVYPPETLPATPTPTASASPAPTATPSLTPAPTGTPTATEVPPSVTPSATATGTPTHTPTLVPTETEAMTPTPTATPAATHTPSPTVSPLATPTPTTGGFRIYLPILVRRTVRVP